MNTTNYRAKKIGGSYQAEGTIVSTFATLAGETRHVFEFDQPAGMLHIFGPGQVEIAAAPQVVADERKPFAFVIVDKDRNPEFVTPDWNSAQEHINDACEMGIENAGKWKAIPAFEMRPTDDKLWDETMRDRDQYHEWADKLSEAIALHFGGDIGEHSNMNCPWAEALEIIDQAAPVQPVAVPDSDPRPLFDRKLADLERRGYEVIGRILHKDGQYALFDSSCRWLEKAQYQRLMHEQDGSLFAAPAAQGDASQAAIDVLAERRRQIEQEGWKAADDDKHADGQMAVAAGYYAMACGYPHERDIGGGIVPQYWPWGRNWWKPKGKRANLVRAGALIVAEIERLDRAAIAAKAAS